MPAADSRSWGTGVVEQATDHNDAGTDCIGSWLQMLRGGDGGDYAIVHVQQCNLRALSFNGFLPVI
jgi:hypothetical protein